MVGSPVAASTGHIGEAKGLRDNAHHHVSRRVGGEVPYPGHREPERRRHDRGPACSPGPCPMRECPPCWTRSATRASGHGTRIVEAGRFYPSSKTCSEHGDCGVVNPDLKREPRWACPSCGVIHDRNENAARNLRKLALLAVGDRCNAPGRGTALAGGDATAGETGPGMKGEPSRRRRFDPPAQDWSCNHCYPFGVPCPLHLA